MTKRILVVLTFLLATLENATAEHHEWLDDWYQIEVIVFEQPASDVLEAAGLGLDQSKYRVPEDLIEPAPERISNVSRAFALTDSERSLLASKSGEFDLSTGTDPWFYSSDLDSLRNGQAINGSQLENETQQLPEWLILPGESYDPFFVHAFELIPFGIWFSEVALEFLNYDPEQEQQEIEEELASLTDQDEVEPEPSGEEGLEPEPTEEEIQTMLDDFRERLIESSFLMDEAGVELPRTAERLRRNNIHIIKHFKWHQSASSLDQEEFVLFTTFDAKPVTGYFGLSKGRFIHFRVNLWVDQIDLIGHDEIQHPVTRLEEHRRVRRADVNYFDHPSIGVLAEVKRVKLPDELSGLVEPMD